MLKIRKELKMRENTLNKKDLAQNLAENLGMDKKNALRSVDFIFSEMANALKDEKIVDIASFGKLYVKERKERKAKNPQTGKEIIISAKKVPAFKASKTLKESINEKDN